MSLLAGFAPVFSIINVHASLGDKIQADLEGGILCSSQAGREFLGRGGLILSAEDKGSKVEGSFKISLDDGRNVIGPIDYLEISRNPLFVGMVSNLSITNFFRCKRASC